MLPKNFIQKQLHSLRTTFFFISLSFSCSLLFVIFTSSTIVTSLPPILFNDNDDDSTLIVVIDWNNCPKDKPSKNPPMPKIPKLIFKIDDNVKETDNIDKPSDDVNNINNQGYGLDNGIEKPDTITIEDFPFSEKDLQKQPHFVGGDRALEMYFRSKLKYTQEANDFQIEGIVKVSFIVEKDGSITNVKLEGNDRLGYGLDEIALKVVKNMPKWVAGMHKNKEVRTLCSIPIVFELED